jgi:hypothetical protein
MSVATVGLDIAKQFFQVDGVDASGRVDLRKKLRRSQVASFLQTLESGGLRRNEVSNGQLLTVSPEMRGTRGPRGTQKIGGGKILSRQIRPLNLRSYRHKGISA